MTYQKLLIDYSDQYPEDENPMAYNFIFGEDEIKEFLEKRNGRRIGIVFKNKSDDDGELVYI
tara:strand:- start:367 stop:552 length:186 start_codon:yes stop_codon:yes gene_type:complete